ncbi:DUF4065 domain-containing protein [Clostridium botulinum]|nr:DUF4065 domain-containing protein [Clostridium botulinum]NFO15467.1 DUF4065 domain-containing protein [Clostridium botulinum]NFQ10240.1 DUF4065 domain-containing protein [Clostridium botulinum]
MVLRLKGGVVMVYKAMEVAQYIINRALDKDKNVSNLKLQKLLYYVQAAFLVDKKEPCFEDDIVNWKHGPVVKEVYDQYKEYSDRNITEYQDGYSIYEFDNDYNFVKRKITFDSNMIDQEDKNRINKVIDELLVLSAWNLVDKTHEEDPWKNTNRFDIISNDSIEDYFRDNQLRIYGVF